MGYDPRARRGTKPFETCDNTLLLPKSWAWARPIYRASRCADAHCAGAVSVPLIRHAANLAAGHSQTDVHFGDRHSGGRDFNLSAAVIIRGRRAAYVLSGLWVLTIVYLIAVYAHLELLRSVLATLAPYTAIALIVMFQSELRRLLARIGRSGGWDWRTTGEARGGGRNSAGGGADVGDETGALIVVERTSGCGRSSRAAWR